MNYFIMCRRKSNGAVLCSNLAFPEREARARVMTHTVVHHRTHNFALVPAPPEHPCWFPEMNKGNWIPMEEFLHHLRCAKRAFAQLDPQPTWPKEAPDAQPTTNPY